MPAARAQGTETGASHLQGAALVHAGIHRGDRLAAEGEMKRSWMSEGPFTSFGSGSVSTKRARSALG